MTEPHQAKEGSHKAGRISEILRASMPTVRTRARFAKKLHIFVPKLWGMLEPMGLIVVFCGLVT